MSIEISAEDQKILNRRATLKALFGLAVVAAGAGALMTPNQAEAAPLLKTPEAPAATNDAEIGRDSDLPKAEPTYYYRRRYYVRPRRRVYYYRPRRVYRRRYVRRIYW